MREKIKNDLCALIASVADHSLYLQKYANRLGDRINKSIYPTKTINEMISSLAEKSQNDERECVEMKYWSLYHGFIPKNYYGFHFKNKKVRERKEFYSQAERHKAYARIGNYGDLGQTYVDKYECYLRYKEYYLRECCLVESEEDFERFNSFYERHNDIVRKPLTSNKGAGVSLIREKYSLENAKRLFDEMICSGRTICEERLYMCEELRYICEQSISTIRLNCYRIRGG